MSDSLVAANRDEAHLVARRITLERVDAIPRSVLTIPGTELRWHIRDRGHGAMMRALGRLTRHAAFRRRSCNPRPSATALTWWPPLTRDRPHRSARGHERCSSAVIQAWSVGNFACDAALRGNTWIRRIHREGSCSVSGSRPSRVLPAKTTKPALEDQPRRMSKSVRARASRRPSQDAWSSTEAKRQDAEEDAAAAPLAPVGSRGRRTVTEALMAESTTLNQPKLCEG